MVQCKGPPQYKEKRLLMVHKFIKIVEQNKHVVNHS